jgi:hypothetical protein
MFAWWKPAGTLGLVLGLCFAAGANSGSAAGDKDSGSLPISEADYNKLVARTAKVLQSSLSASKPSATDVNKAKAAAVMLAAYAQFASGGASEPQRAALQQAALKVSAALKGKKYDDARKAAEGLTSLAPDAKAKLVSGSLLKQADTPLRLVMRQMDTASKGGFGTEAQYKKLTASGGAKKEMPSTQMTEDLALTAYQSAVIAELAKSHTPEKNAKSVKDFQKAADELEKAALLLAQGVKKKDGALALAEVYKVSLTCNRCHAKFRED